MTLEIVNGPRGPVGYRKAGDKGPRLALLAGMGSTSFIWGDLIQYLGRSFQVLALDNRGVGGSRSGEPFSYRNVALDLMLVADKEGWDSFAVLGASMGGAIALEAAAISDRVSCLVLLSTAFRLSPYTRRVVELVDRLLKGPDPQAAGVLLASFGFAPEFVERHPGVVEQVAELWGPNPEDVPGIRGQIRFLLGSWDLEETAKGLKLPALVATGTRDALIPWEETRALAKALPKSRFLVVENAGHSLLAESPELLAEVERFIENL